MDRQETKIDKLVFGGQGIGTLADGRKAFVWNSLPGETVLVRITRNRRDYVEGIAESVVVPSIQRIEPRDEAFLSTSPWQIMSFESENDAKRSILVEQFEREHVFIPHVPAIITDGVEWHYRNKMEYSFWGDESGLHLALFNRGSHGKKIVTGSSIAREEIDEAAIRITRTLHAAGVRAGSLKTVIIRCSQAGEVAAALFVKDRNFPDIKELSQLGFGLKLIYSNPKSPASVVTEVLNTFGSDNLSDSLLGTTFSYDTLSFFQVNVPVFTLALKDIKEAAGEDGSAVIDLYAGVGSIGLSIGANVMVELDATNIERARHNAADKKVEIIHAGTEKALDYITHESTIIVDPPRAGLHEAVISRLLEIQPKRIIYLSCNPATQARDMHYLQDTYQLSSLKGYNFFPRTPHIESLAVMIRK